MAFQPAPNCINATLRFLNGGTFYGINSLNFVGLNRNPFEDYGFIAAEIVDWWEEEIAGLVSDEIQLASISLRGLSEPSDYYYSNDLTGIVGLVDSPAQPPNVTLSIKTETGLTGKSRRGRVFHVGLAESMVSNKYLLPAWPGLFASNYQLLIDAVSGFDLSWCVLSRTQNKVKLAEAIPYPITSCTLVDNRVDTLRRRVIAD